MPERIPPLRILLIEDNEDHAKILRWAFERSERQPSVTFFPDGETALKHLQAQNKTQSLSPDLIFLDFNLPRVDGRDVLQFLKSDPATKGVPVIILSSSENEEDVRRAYELGASTYITKSLILRDLSVALQNIIDYWSKIARLPHRS